MIRTFIGCLLFLIGNGSSLYSQNERVFPLTRIGELSESPQLDHYYSIYARPLIIINTTIYIPNDRCVRLRDYGGAYSLKDLDGNTVLKTDAGESMQKNLESDDSQKTQDADEMNKSTGGNQDEKAHKGAIETRDKEGEVDQKNTEGADADKQTGGDEVMKTAEGAIDTRNESAASEEKSFGGVTLFIKCFKDEEKFSLRDFYGKERIQIFDINGLREVASVNIEYEQ